MKKLLTLAAAALMLASPAFADDDDKDGRKSSQHWNPNGGYGWQQDDRDDDHDRGRDRDRDGDHDRWDHRRDWEPNDNRWNTNSGWNNGYRYGGGNDVLGRWALVNFDYNRNGRLERFEFDQSRRAFFDLADRNGDGMISDKDWRKFIDKYAYRTDIGFRYGGPRGGQPRYEYRDPWRR